MFAHGLTVGKFAPFHRGHQLLVETALAECREVTLLVYANPDFPAMPQAMRAGWIRTLYPSVRVLAPEDPPPDASDDRTHRDYASRCLLRHGLRPDAVFSSEDYGPGFAAHIGAAHRMVDRNRVRVPVSGRAIRADLAGHRAWLEPRVRVALGMRD